MDCDIVLLPDAQIAAVAIAASQKLGVLGSEFVLDSSSFYPHLSLYMVRLRLNDLTEVHHRLADIAASIEPMYLHATGYDQERGYVVLDYDTPEPLDALQQAVVAAINPIRDGMLAKDRERMIAATGLALQNFEQYGYKYIGHLFKPHITLTRFSDTTPIDTSILPQIPSFSGSFSKLGLFELGPNNTCVRKLAELPLAAR